MFLFPDVSFPLRVVSDKPSGVSASYLFSKSWPVSYFTRLSIDAPYLCLYWRRCYTGIVNCVIQLPNSPLRVLLSHDEDISLILSRLRVHSTSWQLIPARLLPYLRAALKDCEAQVQGTAPIDPGNEALDQTPSPSLVGCVWDRRLR